MIRISLKYWYEIGSKIHPLTTLSERHSNGQIKLLNDVLFELYEAEGALRGTISSYISPLRASLEGGRVLLATLESYTNPGPEGPELEKEISSYEIYRITNQAREFETVLGAELRIADAYFVAQKGLYSTTDLLERADIALDEDTARVLPTGAINDFRQAGRCLALELSTASGFHILRATESVLRTWYALVVPNAVAKPNWAQCVEQLRKAGADKKTLAVVDQIRDLHRNELAHDPDVFLDVKAALRLFDIAKDAIIAMAEQINAHNAALTPPLPMAAPAALLP